jgi:hypothetical protein
MAKFYGINSRDIHQQHLDTFTQELKKEPRKMQTPMLDAK